VFLEQTKLSHEHYLLGKKDGRLRIDREPEAELPSHSELGCEKMVGFV
jgi:hypothetical protein